MSADAARENPVPLLQAGRTFGVIGAGVMGQTIVKGLLTANALSPSQVWASARSAATCEAAARTLGVPVESDPRARVADAGIIVLSVKPAQGPAAVRMLKDAGVRPDTLLITILAGTRLKELEAELGTENPWVRAMPNTPCVVGEGMTAICAGSHATAVHLAQAQQVFDLIGRTVRVDEIHFDAITALSGSGPAYQFLIMEALADAGVRVGLPRDLALALVAQTAVGAGRMVQLLGRHPAALRDDVTTPAGCTIGGLLMLEDGKIRSVLARAIEEATRIAGGLGKKTDPRS